MVRHMRLLIYCALVALLVGLVWILRSSVGIDRRSPFATLMFSALASYRETHGVFPNSLEDIEPVLEANYGVKVSISRVSKDKYHVEIVTPDGAACKMEVKYVVTSDGVWEDYDGKILEGCSRY